MTTELNGQKSLVPFVKPVTKQKHTDRLPQSIKLMINGMPVLFEASTSSVATLGRGTPESPVTVDFSLFRGQEMGISRKHAIIEIFGERLMLKDLGSVNGTRLNGMLLISHHVYQIFHGDEIQLGKMYLRIYFVFS